MTESSHVLYSTSKEQRVDGEMYVSSFRTIGDSYIKVRAIQYVIQEQSKRK